MSLAVHLSARHFPSGVNLTPDLTDINFKQYIAQSRALIKQARQALGENNTEQIIEHNAPFELTPSTFIAGENQRFKRGILLTHGLSDSPYFMRALGKFFQEQGFRVMSVLLPGHGTQAGDLLEVSYHAWQKTVAYGCQQLAPEVDDIYLGGFSAGGALSILQSLNDPRIRGLFLFAPALKIPSKATWALLSKYYDWLMPSAKWVSLHLDHDVYKYQSLPKNAVVQMWALTKLVEQQLNSSTLTLPIFTAASADDATVNSTAILRFLQRHHQPANRLVWYQINSKMPSCGLPLENLEIVNSALPEQKILSSAHTAIVLPPEDCYYGRDSQRHNCLHYFPHDPIHFEACQQKNAALVWGEITDENLRAGLLARLTYNPHFAELKKSMQRFIEALP